MLITLKMIVFYKTTKLFIQALITITLTKHHITPNSN